MQRHIVHLILDNLLQTKGKSLEQIQQHFRGTIRHTDEEAILDDNVEATIEAEVNAEINTVRS